MAKYNILTVESDGKQFVFVTRGKSQPFTLEEARAYLGRVETIKDIVEEEAEPAWQIPDDRQRRLMFMKDLGLGVDFCVKKYGVSKETIIDEARRIAPHLNYNGIK